MYKQSHSDKEVKSGKKISWFKWIITFILFLILLFVFALFLLRIPTVQNWLVDRVANSFSEKLDTRIEIGSVNLDIRKGLILDEFYMEGLEGDTLIYGKELSTGFAQSLYSLLNNELSLSYITLTDAQVNFVRRKGNKANNIASLFSRLKQKENDSQGTGFKFDLGKVGFDNIRFSSIDEVTNKNIKVKVENGVIDIVNITDSNKPLEFSKVFFYRPQFEYITRNSSSVVNIKQGDDITTDVSLDTASFQGIKISEFQIQEASIKHQNLDKQNKVNTEYFDYQNLDLSNLNILVHQLDFKSINDLSLELKRMSFADKNKFIVDNISSSRVSMTDKKIALADFSLKTPTSEISDFLALHYSELSDFKDFAKKVRLEIDFKGTDITLSDLNYFIPDLTNNDFFIKNKDRHLRISGKIGNRINNLSGRDVQIAVGTGTLFKGSFNTRNLTFGTEALLNIKVDEFTTDINALKSIVPNFNPPSNFYKLGSLSFAGRFDGYVENFVAYGSLNTDLGKAEMDINLNVQDGSESAEYSGELALIDFNLAQWTGNNDFGLVNFESYIEDGRGLTQETAFANMDAVVQSFVYKGYTYSDFSMDGKLDRNQFVGLFRIKDPNADFFFDGEILIEDNVPKFDFVADIENLDLQALKLTKNKSILKGKINLNAQGNSIQSVHGQSLLQGISYTNEEDTYYLESVFVESFLKENIRHVDLSSDIGSVSIEGLMDFRLMQDGVKKIFKESYPHHFRKMYVDYEKATTTQDFKFDVNISDSKNLLSLAGLKGCTIQDLKLSGELNTQDQYVDIKGDLARLILKKDTIYNVHVAGVNKDKLGQIKLDVDSLFVSGRKFNAVGLLSDFKKNQINFNLKSHEVFDSLQALDLGGTLTANKDGYLLNLDDGNLEMLGSEWKFDANNEIYLGDKTIQVEGLVLADVRSNRKIRLNDINNKGLALSLNEFNFLTINGLIDYDKIDFAGEGDVEIMVDNIFNLQNLEAKVNIPQLTLNDEVYGQVDVLALKQNGGDYQLDVGIVGDKMQLALKAVIDAETQALNGRLFTKDVPFSLFQKIIPDGISEVEGGMDADIKLYGDLSEPKMEGELKVMNGAVKIDYVGEKYFTHNQPVYVTHDLIDFRNGTITDHEGNEATIKGTMSHEFVKNFVMDVELAGDDMIIVNTTENDNPFYYGLGKGKASVKFTGPFSNANMLINATTGPETVMSIPVQYAETGYEDSFIKFVKKDELLDRGDDISLDSFKIEGLDVEMNISITPEAQLNVIFDQQLNDVLRGRGTGDVQVYITREGEFLAYGDFIIETGSYNLSIYNFANKAFNIRKGGTIRWTGDPINTNLDISADYEDLKTSLNVFLAEYLGTGQASATAEAEAGRKKDVDLLMHIGGTLYEPIVNFDLEFPDIESAELRSYVESKMRSLRTDANSLNDQVAGLITFNTFLPSTNNQRLGLYTGNTVIETATSTISEMISNQFSYLITNFINEAIGDNNIISNIDVELGLNQNNTFSQDAGLLDLFDPDEIESYLNARFKFLDEKFSLRVGGNYIRRANTLQNPVLNQTLVGDVAIEYDITDDRRLKLRFYNRFDRDEVSGNPKNKSGLGLSYRKEFGSLVDFKTDISRLAREADSEIELDN